MLALIANETKKATAAMVTEMVTNTVDDTIAHEIQPGYSSMVEGRKAPIFTLVQEAFIDVILRDCLDMIQVHVVNKLVE